MGEAFLIVGVQGLELAVRASIVREIVGKRAWVPVPGARHELPGIITWGGRAVAILDLARLAPRLHPLAPSENRARVLILEVGDSVLAVAVDSVSELRTIEDHCVAPRRVHDFPLARHEVDLGEAVVPLLDPLLLLERTVDDAPRI